MLRPESKPVDHFTDLVVNEISFTCHLNGSFRIFSPYFIQVNLFTAELLILLPFFQRLLNCAHYKRVRLDVLFLYIFRQICKASIAKHSFSNGQLQCSRY